MIRPKRLPITFIALAALFGIINCVAVEPALAQIDGHHTEATTEKDGHCDFICHSSHHLWTVGSTGIALEQPLKSLGSIALTFKVDPDPPLKGIFHPPAVL